MSYIFNNYFNHLQRVFQKLKDFNIMFNPKKSFLIYPSIVLLEQKIDILDLMLIKNKLAIIQILSFSKLLKQLEYYLRGRDRSVKIRRSPGHTGIPGNEKTDELADLGVISGRIQTEKENQSFISNIHSIIRLLVK